MGPITGQYEGVRSVVQYSTTYYVAMPHAWHAAMQPTVSKMSCRAESARLHSVTSETEYVMLAIRWSEPISPTVGLFNGLDDPSLGSGPARQAASQSGRRHHSNRCRDGRL